MYKSIYCGNRDWLYNNNLDMSHTAEPRIDLTALCFDSETGWKIFMISKFYPIREYANRIG